MCHVHGLSLRLAGQRPAPSDLHLISAVERRDEAALTALYERYGALIFTLALRRLGDRELAEEVLQDVFLRCWEHAASYRPEAGSVASWLFGIARNRSIDVRRRRSVAVVHHGACDMGEGIHGLQICGGWCDAGEALARRFEVRDALAALTAVQREAIALAYFEDLSQSQIADRLGVPLGTVKTRLRAAMERLRRTLAALPGSEPNGTAVRSVAAETSPGSMAASA
jgi:RNA polymerase sigma-70 factor (ECF subfamily)